MGSLHPTGDSLYPRISLRICVIRGPQLRNLGSTSFPIRAKKEPGPSVSWSRAITWRRPTLTGPIVPLPSALRRFTSGFGMGPGGSTALWSPEGGPVQSGPGLWGHRAMSSLFFSASQVFSFSASTPSARSLTSIWRYFRFFTTSLTGYEPFTVTLSISDSKNRNQAERMISTSQLNMLPCLHLKPINVVVFDDPSGKIHLGNGLALRCFQRLSVPHLATRPCS